MKKKSTDIKISSNKSFGIVFFIFFLLIFIWPLFNNENLRIWAIAPAVLFLILGLTNSRLLTPLNHAWNKLGIIIGKFVSPIIMSSIFFLVVTPTGLIGRLMGKDFLRLI